jgi:hypothetical protein
LVKYLAHLAFSSVAQGSKVNENSASNRLKKSGGVGHSSVLLVNSPSFTPR